MDPMADRRNRLNGSDCGFRGTSLPARRRQCATWVRSASTAFSTQVRASGSDRNPATSAQWRQRHGSLASRYQSTGGGERFGDAVPQIGKAGIAKPRQRRRFFRHIVLDQSPGRRDRHGVHGANLRRPGDDRWHARPAQNRPCTERSTRGRQGSTAGMSRRLRAVHLSDAVHRAGPGSRVMACDRGTRGGVSGGRRWRAH
jgi:hypothetical protein